jgi:SAM-dependent methyltransferase
MNVISPYSKTTTITMWSDPYISKQMLQYHLQFDNDIASRKYATIEKTVDFLSNFIGKEKSICDFGCGPGLYTNLLQHKGHTVYGVDISESSLAYAQSRNAHVTYQKMNYIETPLPHKIDVGMMIWCDFGAMLPDGRVEFLKNLRKSLNLGGLFIFDVFSVHRFDTLYEQENTYQDTDGFFMEGPCTVITKLVKYPALKLSLSYDKAVGNRTVELYNWDKHYDPYEMKILLEDNGFELLDYYSDTVGNKAFTNNEIYLFIAKMI